MSYKTGASTRFALFASTVALVLALTVALPLALGGLGQAAAAQPASAGASAPAGAPGPAAATAAPTPTAAAPANLADTPPDDSRGLWIGPIHACRDTAESVPDAGGSGGPVPTVIVTLRADLRAALERETARRIGTAMPIRLDGKLIMAPIVREPITGGVLAISGSSEEEMDAIQAAIRQPC